jgi:hypothetical protein
MDDFLKNNTIKVSTGVSNLTVLSLLDFPTLVEGLRGSNSLHLVSIWPEADYMGYAAAALYGRPVVIIQSGGVSAMYSDLFETRPPTTPPLVLEYNGTNHYSFFTFEEYCTCKQPWHVMAAKSPSVAPETIVECSGPRDGETCRAGAWFHRKCIKPIPSESEWATYENSPYQCPSCRPRSRKRKQFDDDASNDDDEEEGDQGRPRTFTELPDLTRERALTRLLAVLGQDEFPPADDAGVAELASRWEADIDNEQHPIAEVRQWHLYRIGHLYDAPTTQRLIIDPHTATWIANKRAAAMDTGETSMF